MSLTFTCEKCGAHRLEEVMTDVIVISEVIEIRNDGECGYGRRNSEDGEIDSFQCSAYGWVLPSSEGNVRTYDELAEFLGDQ